jgi:hypothetical protein
MSTLAAYVARIRTKAETGPEARADFLAAEQAQQVAEIIMRIHRNGQTLADLVVGQRSWASDRRAKRIETLKAQCVQDAFALLGDEAQPRTAVKVTFAVDDPWPLGLTFSTSSPLGEAFDTHPTFRLGGRS